MLSFWPINNFDFIADWKITNIDCFLQKLAVGAPRLTSITLAGWKGFTSDNLAFLVENMKNLKRLDLSSINVSTINSEMQCFLLIFVYFYTIGRDEF